MKNLILIMTVSLCLPLLGCSASIGTTPPATTTTYVPTPVPVPAPAPVTTTTYTTE